MVPVAFIVQASREAGRLAQERVERERRERDAREREEIAAARRRQIEDARQALREGEAALERRQFDEARRWAAAAQPIDPAGAESLERRRKLRKEQT